MAYFDYSNPALAPDALPVTMSAIGGFILVVSGILFFAVLIRGQAAARTEPGAYRFSTAIHPPVRLPAALNGYAIWVGLMIGLTITNYGYPIMQLLATPKTSVPAVYVGAQR